MTKAFDYNYQEKTLQQFESYPFPSAPLEKSPKNDVQFLYKNSLVTAYYHRNRKVIQDLSQSKILDMGCGTGYTTLILAEANPGAKIVAVDISFESLKLAEARLKYHGFNDVVYHVIALEDITSLGIKFDYINASDILYFLPDIAMALKQLGNILKPEGIIRGNLHSYYQRFNYYRAQELFKQMGLMDGNPEEIELKIVRDFFNALKDTTDLKMKTWGNHHTDKVQDETILMNYLMQNDHGFTIPQLLDFLKQANLSLVDMVNWWEWQLADLFKDPENLPVFLAMGFANLEREEQLRFYELIHPNKRLLDFWCGHPIETPELSSSNLAIENWKEINIFLHPCLISNQLKQAVLDANALFPLNLKDYIPFLSQEVWSDRGLLSVLFVPLLERSQSLDSLVKRWLQVHPIHPVTLMPTTLEEAFMIVSQAIINYERLGIILLEQN